MDTRVVGVSVDHVPCLKAWADSLGGIDYPLLSDFWPHGAVASEWSVFRAEDGRSERALFVVDRTGVVRYADVHDIDDQPSNDELFAVLEELEPELAMRSRVREAAEDIEAATSDGESRSEIVMFCTPWCPDCKRAREWLAAHHIEYREIDISRDPDARDHAAAHNEGRLHTPTFEIGDEVCVDFRPARLRVLLGLNAQDAETHR